MYLHIELFRQHQIILRNRLNKRAYFVASDAVEAPGPSPPGTLENPLIGKNMTFIFQYDYNSKKKKLMLS